MGIGGRIKRKALEDGGGMEVMEGGRERAGGSAENALGFIGLRCWAMFALFFYFTWAG
jgi:hypothetical protein